MTLAFRVLGPLEVHDGDRPVPLTGGAQRRLLGALALRAGRVVSPDELIDAIWPDGAPDGAHKALQVHVSRLRKQLGAGTVETRPGGYVLRGAVDLARFEAALAAAARATSPRDAREALRGALALWRGPPLPELGDSAALRGELARLDELRLRAIEDRIDAELALGAHAQAAVELEALVAAHPLRERLRSQLMLALYRCGRQGDALAVYRDTRARLVEELGIEPGRPLRAVEARILAQDPGLDLPAPPAPARPADDLVGRERELDALRPVVEAALGGRGGLVLVGGEPGIGKTRLAESLGRIARESGAAVAVGRCWEAGGAPAYWPWVQALRAFAHDAGPDELRAIAGDDARTLAPLLPELAPAPPPAADDDGARFRLFAAVGSLLRRASAARPLALFLDDLHAADQPSLALLRYVAAELGGAAVLVVGCYRDTEVGRWLADALPDLAREAGVHRVALRGLGAADTARLLEAAGAHAGAGLAAQVFARTEGNPLFAVEMGRLLAVEPPAAGEPLPLPAGVSETIGRRVQRRSRRCREALALASVIGREFTVEALAGASDLGEDELDAALEEAAGARLIGNVPDVPGRLRFSHMLVRDVLYEGLPAGRRMRLHRRVGEALEALYARDPEPHLAELAHHFERAGSATAEQAAAYAERAGHRAVAQHAPEEAARHFARALDAAGAADAARTCELLLALGDAHSRAGDEASSKDALRRAAGLAEREGWPERLARAAVLYGGRLRWARASTDPDLVPLLERGLAALGPGDDATRVALLTRLADAHRDDRTGELRAALAAEAVAIADRSGEPALRAQALAAQWYAQERPDNVANGLAFADEVIALARRAGDPEQEFLAHDMRLQALWISGDRDALDVELAVARRLADELRQPSQRWSAATAETMLALMEGRLDEAEALIEEAAALGRRAMRWNAGVTRLIARFVLRREQGRLAELEPEMARAVHEYPSLLRFRCALAGVHAHAGADAEARAVLDGLARLDLATEHVDSEWLFSMCVLADACARAGHLELAERLSALLLPHRRLYAQAPVEAAFGSVALALGELALARGRAEEAAGHLEAAVEIERRMRARPWLERAQAALARAGGAAAAAPPAH